MNASDKNNDDDIDDIDDGEPTADEIASMRRATPAQAEGVDALILSKCTTRWQKVAAVVGSSLDEYELAFPGLPYVYMQVRMLEMEDAGIVEIQGDVMSMRASEVRLSAAGKVAAA